MSRRPSPAHAQKLLSTARTNPGFALWVARELPKEAHGAFVSALSHPRDTATAPRPGVRKCPSSPFSASNGLTAQLALFARAGVRVR